MIPAHRNQLTRLLKICLPLLISLSNGCTIQSDWQTTAKNAQQATAKRQWASAEQFYRKAITQLDSVTTDSTARIDLLTNLGKSLLADNKLAEATQTFDQALSNAERKFGAENLQLVPPLNGLREVTYKQKQFDQSERFARRVLQIEEKAWGPKDVRLEDALSNVVGTSCIAGKCSDDVDLLERLTALRTEKHGAQHPFTCVSRQLLAEALLHHRKYADANDLYMMNLDAAKKNNPTLVPAALARLATVQSAQAKYDEAEKTLQNAIGLQRHIDLHSGNLISSIELLAQTYEKHGKAAKAVETYGEMLALAEKDFGKDSPGTSTYLQEYATALKNAGRIKQSAAYQSRAEMVAQKEEDAKRADLKAGS